MMPLELMPEASAQTLPVGTTRVPMPVEVSAEQRAWTRAR